MIALLPAATVYPIMADCSTHGRDLVETT